MYVLSVQYSCAVVSVFLFGGKANLVLLTLFYSTLLALTDGLTDRRTDRGTTTLASRGLEEPFFQLFCCVVLVFGSCGIKVFDLLSVCWVCVSGDYDRKKKIQSSV